MAQRISIDNQNVFNPWHPIDNRWAWEHWSADACIWATENISPMTANYTFLSVIYFSVICEFFSVCIDDRFIFKQSRAGVPYFDNVCMLQVALICWSPTLLLAHGTALLLKQGESPYWGYPFLFVVFVFLYTNSFERVSFSKKFPGFDWCFHLFRIFCIAFISTLILIAEAANYINGCL